jgi:hypothetical protein
LDEEDGKSLPTSFSMLAKDGKPGLQFYGMEKKIPIGRKAIAWN